MSSIMTEDWIDVELGELSLLELGGDWGKDPNIEDNEYLEAYCIRGSEFRNWENDKGKTASLRKIKKDSIEKRNLLLDDILVEISGGGPEQPVGRTVVIEHSVLNHFKDKNLVCTNFLRLIRPSVFVNSIYLNHYLKYFYSTGKIIPYQSGSNNLRNLKFNDYLTIEIPFSPLPIQRAIVSKIEALFSDLDNGIANFKKAQEQLKIYRQAVLKKAFEGELTKEWRVKTGHALSQQGLSLPTAEELLKQIKQERQNHYNQQIEDWKKAVKEWEKNGSVDDKPRKPSLAKELPPLKKDELEKLPNLPDGWAWVKLGFLSQKIQIGPFGTQLHKHDYISEGVPIINPKHIKVQKITPDIFISYEKAKSLSQYLLKTNDVILGRRGEMGRTALITEKQNNWMCGTGSLFIRFSENFNGQFYCMNLSERRVVNYLNSEGSGTTMTNLNNSIINDLPIQLLSRQEQTQIVQEIESRLSVCDKMEQSISESLEKAEALRQSILKKAFEGKLLSQAEIELCKQAADYEPASELLKKIQAEKLAILQQAQDAKKKKPSVKKKSKN